MTRELRIAFCGEGNTDSRVIPIFIEKIIAAVQRTDEINHSIDAQRWNGQGKLLDVCVSLVDQAKILHHLIIFHADADGPDNRQTRRQKVEPISAELAKHHIDHFPVVWAIPVHAVEAWLFASPEAFSRALTQDERRAEDLHLPRRPDQIHRDSAKQLFSESVYTLLARTQRQRRRITPSHFYEAVAQEIALDDLRRLAAFSEFEQEFTEVLTQLGYVA